MREILAAIDAPHFVAGIVLRHDRVIEAADVVHYMRGWQRDRVREYCRRKNWKIAVVGEPKGKRVLVCGGRDFADYDLLKTTLSALQITRGRFALVIHGAARGADRMAGTYAERHDIPCHEYPADWQAHGKAAGPLRNQQMLKLGKPDLVVAFAGGRGTADMVQQARAANVEVIEVC